MILIVEAGLIINPASTFNIITSFSRLSRLVSLFQQSRIHVTNAKKFVILMNECFRTWKGSWIDAMIYSLGMCFVDENSP